MRTGVITLLLIGVISPHLELVDTPTLYKTARFTDFLVTDCFGHDEDVQQKNCRIEVNQPHKTSR